MLVFIFMQPTYFNWAPGQPSDAGEFAECVDILDSTGKEGMWNVHLCKQPKPFICQKQACKKLFQYLMFALCNIHSWFHRRFSHTLQIELMLLIHLQPPGVSI